MVNDIKPFLKEISKNKISSLMKQYLAVNYEDISFMEQTPGVEPESFKLASQYLCPRYSYLVVVLHQLDDDPDVIRVVLD